MKTSVPLIVAACLVLAPIPAGAQTCPNPTPISCGDLVSDNTSSGTNNLEEYPCLPDIYDGPEKFYLLTLEHGAELQVRVTPTSIWGWDVALIIMPSLGGDCYPPVYNGCADEYWYDYEQLYGVLGPGDYFIVVDGYWGDYGPYDLEITCTECVNCVDGDGDGYAANDPTGCPCGTDCNDSDPDCNPGALEICGDGTDQDCDGQDNPCSNCSSHLSIQCGDSGTADTGDGSDILDSYCDSGFTQRSAREYVFSITPQTDGVIDFTATDMGSEQLDAFAFRSFGMAGVCNQDACVDASILTTGTQRLAFWGQAGETYYISVDGSANNQGPFGYNAECRAEQCTAGSAILCGDDIAGDTSVGANTVSAYKGLPWHLLGPEDIYSLTVSGNDAEVAVTLEIDDPGTPPDLALVIVEDDGAGACLPDHGIAVSDFVQQQGFNPPEFVTFTAAAGVTYFVVVDGYNAGDSGSYRLRVDCAVECSPGETDCDGVCVDLDTDVNHCGSCDIACSVVNGTPTCVSGSCGISSCDAGWDDCDSDYATGCETDLRSDDSNCGSCDNACHFDNAAASCDAGSCVMGACDALWGDCDSDPANGCETDLRSDDSNCGECGRTCTPPEFCSEGVCGGTCGPGLDRCGDECVDLDTDVNHCGHCDTVCTVANGTPICVSGNCGILSCDAGWGDCDSDYTTGCETTLGTDTNCSACGDTCSFNHASGSCVAGSCVLGNCETGWGDCDSNPQNGCESDLTSEQTCGTCSNSCGAGEFCMNGQCVSDCPDADSDGHQDESCGGDDCDDNNSQIHPQAQEDCDDEADNDCDDLTDCDDTDCATDPGCTCPDDDHDGHQDESCGGDDCDDNNSQIHPQAQEDCDDDADNDCDGFTDCDDTDCAMDAACTCPDADGDGHQAFNCGGNDCDDSQAGVHPGAIEICGDGIDQDCDGKDRSCGEADSGCSCGGGAGSSAPAFLAGLMMMLGLRRRRF